MPVLASVILYNGTTIDAVLPRCRITHPCLYTIKNMASRFQLLLLKSRCAVISKVCYSLLHPTTFIFIISVASGIQLQLHSRQFTEHAPLYPEAELLKLKLLSYLAARYATVKFNEIGTKEAACVRRIIIIILLLTMNGRNKRLRLYRKC